MEGCHPGHQLPHNWEGVGIVHPFFSDFARQSIGVVVHDDVHFPLFRPYLLMCLVVSSDAHYVVVPVGGELHQQFELAVQKLLLVLLLFLGILGLDDLHGDWRAGSEALPFEYCSLAALAAVQGFCLMFIVA